MFSALLALALAVTPSATIPPIRGTTFAGEIVTLPDALRGRAGVLIVGFSKASRQQASAWGHRLADDPQRPPQLAYYEMPVLESVPKLLRGLVLKQIKEDVSANGQKHFLPIMDHEANWKSAAGFAQPDDAYLLLVDASGAVRWRTQGSPTEQTYSELKRRAAQILP